MSRLGRLLVAAALVALAAWAVVSYARDRRHEQTARARRFEESRQYGPDAVRGYWVWTREVEDGRTLREITADDMVPKVGTYGWPGCPRGIICTAMGVRMLAFGQNRTAHFITNVTTSSDYQHHATWDWIEPGLLRFTSRRHYSCAHPDVRELRDDVRWMRFRRDGDFLHVSVEDFNLWGISFAPRRPAAHPSRWIVFRRIPRDVFYGRYLLRRCQPLPGVDCDADCDSMNLVE